MGRFKSSALLFTVSCITALGIMAINVFLVIQFIQDQDAPVGVILIVILCAIGYFGVCFRLMWSEIVAIFRFLQRVLLGRGPPAIRASGDEFRSNVHRGGSVEAIDLDPVYADTAVRAAQIMGLRVAGVDMLEGAEGLRRRLGGSPRRRCASRASSTRGRGCRGRACSSGQAGSPRGSSPRRRRARAVVHLHDGCGHRRSDGVRRPEICSCAG